MMKKLTVVMLLILSVVAFADDMVKLKSVKDREMIKCLSNYIKNNRTHITMIINEKGERELLIPKSYLDYCRKKLN